MMKKTLVGFPLIMLCGMAFAGSKQDSGGTGNSTGKAASPAVAGQASPVVSAPA